MGRRRGFTLVELLIVIGLCGLWLAFSFPAFNNFKESIRLEASARELASDLRKTQALAMSRNESLAFSSFEFSSSGFPPPGGSGTQVLKNSRGRSKKVIVSSAGRVRIE